MPKFNVTQTESKLRIKIDDVGDKQADFRRAFDQLRVATFHR